MIPQFGRAPRGKRLDRLKQSLNYRNGQFHNQSPTPALVAGENYFSLLRKFFFGKSKRSKPTSALPSTRVDLHSLDPENNLLVWFGHSSYYLQLDGKRFLIDPVFSGNASPLPYTNRSFRGSDIYAISDVPLIDYLLITHDHYDHLDYKSIRELRPKIKHVVTGLGVASHLEYWGYDPNVITELDWSESHELDSGFKITALPARHFSGRLFKRNTTLWVSFVLSTPTQTLYIGGDSGYDSHFARIGEEFGPFALAILENGQYNESWPYIHMMPEQVVQAAIDLKAKLLLPVHWAKFVLALHDWDDPIKRVVAAAEEHDLNILHPLIGEPVNLKHPAVQKKWWQTIK